MRIVIAPDSFTGSSSAHAAAQALAAGWCGARPDDEVILRPQADGGVGTLEVVAAAVPEALLHEVGPVTGPDARPTPGSWLELPGRVGLVELAQSSALTLMAAPAPLRATTRGLGEVIAHALDAGVTRLLIGLGGSASTDGGTGALSALGMRFLGAHGLLPDGGGALRELRRIDAQQLREAPVGGVALWCDVEAPLTGPHGAAAVFGPQKGATVDDIRVLDAGMARLARLLGGEPDAPGAGAAGGTAYGLQAAWGAAIGSGAAAIAELTGLTRLLRSADLVITGEGRIDGTSATGKVVGTVASLADAAGVPVALVGGTIDPGAAGARPSVTLAGLAGSARASMADPEPHLREAGRILATDPNVSRGRLV